MSQRLIWDVYWKDEKNEHLGWQEIGIIVEAGTQVKFKMHAHCPASYLTAVQNGGGWCMAWQRKGKKKGGESQ